MLQRSLYRGSPTHLLSLAQTFLHVLHDPHFARIFALGRGNAFEVDFAGEGKMLFDLIFASHRHTLGLKR